MDYRKKLAEITVKSKKKTPRQSLKAGISYLKLECAKMFLMKFFQYGSNFGRKF